MFDTILNLSFWYHGMLAQILLDLNVGFQNHMFMLLWESMIVDEFSIESYGIQVHVTSSLKSKPFKIYTPFGSLGIQQNWWTNATICLSCDNMWSSLKSTYVNSLWNILNDWEVVASCSKCRVSMHTQCYFKISPSNIESHQTLVVKFISCSLLIIQWV